MPVATATVRRDRHALTGPSVRLDPRLYPVRSDLTDVRLADRVFAPHYAAACERMAQAIAPLRTGTAKDSPILSELLPGDPFELFEMSEAVAWGRSMVDGIVGYVDAAALGDLALPSHRVVEQPALLREAPDRNAVTLASLPLGSRVASLGERGDYLLTAHGYVATSAVLPLNESLPGGIAAAAAMLVGVPARAGGRSGVGVDPHGLVFLAHDLAGIAAPRLPDALSEALMPGDSVPRPGDIVMLDGYPAMLIDAETVVHVVGDRVVREPLTAAIERGGAIGAFGRLA